MNLGVKNYGIYIFVSTVAGLLGLLEFGLGVAVIKRLSFLYGEKNFPLIARLVHTANSLYFLMGSVALLVATIGTVYGPMLLPEKFASYQEYASLFFIGGLIFFVNAVYGVYSVTLIALQRFDIATKLGIVSATISSTGMLAIAMLHGTLEDIFLFQLALVIVMGMITFYLVKQALPVATYRFAWNIDDVKSSYKFGIVAFINQMANTSLSSLDRLILPFFVGPTNLTYYSVPGNVTTKIPGLTNVLTNTLFPTVSELDGSGDKERIVRLYVRSFRLIIVIAAALTVTAVSFAHEVLLYWLNADFADKATEVFIVLAITGFVLSLFGPLSNFLLGLGRLKFLTQMSIGMGIFNILLLVLLVPHYGILGAAWAYLISVLPVFYIFYYIEKSFSDVHKKHTEDFYYKSFVGTIITSGIVWIVNTLLLSFFVKNLPSLLVIGFVSIVLYIIIYRILGYFEDEDWNDFLRFYKHIQYKIFAKK